MSSLPKSVRIGTRGSELARWQAEHMAAAIRALGVDVELIEIKTQGDLDQRTAFGQIGTKGIFTKEIEEALLDNRIDLAVHSLKDLPTDLPQGLALSAVPPRVTPLDGWVCPSGQTLMELPAGSSVATGSLRREAQIRALRPDLNMVPIRGNVPTRIQKTRDGLADATLLAVAGLRRLGLEDALTSVFDAETITPPMGQGALGIETRAGELQSLCEKLNDPPSRTAVEAERAFLRRIGGGCKTPAGIYARNDGDGWLITGMLASATGERLLRRQTRCAAQANPAPAALALAESMLAEAHPAILETLHAKEAADE